MPTLIVTRKREGTEDWVQEEILSFKTIKELEGWLARDTGPMTWSKSRGADGRALYTRYPQAGQHQRARVII